MPSASVTRVRECRLRRASKAWSYEQRYSREIANHWQKRLAESPSFFNGRIFMMEPPSIDDGILSAQMIETNFAAYLHWKDSGYPDKNIHDGFGSAIIRANGGEILLSRQHPGQVNSATLCLPSGFIDRNDLTKDGDIDIAASIVRELEEETGLPPSVFARGPDFLVTQVGTNVSIAIEFRSSKTATELREELLANLARQSEPELCDFVIFSNASEAQSNPDVAAYARLAMCAVFAGT